jgi:hypothetical protein
VHKTPFVSFIIAVASLTAFSTHAQDTSTAPDGAVRPVTVDNFARAETDTYFAAKAKQVGLGKMLYQRTLVPIENQLVIRSNRDTLYSSGVFDLDAGPVTITLPDSGTRYMSLQLTNEDHYVPHVFYGAGSYVLTKENIGTRYVLAQVRILVDPNKPADVQAVHALQDKIAVNQKSVGALELPTWDPVSQKKVRDALQTLSTTVSYFNKAFGTKAEVDPIQHLIGTAAGWGGIPGKDAVYLNITPPKNDGQTFYRLRIKEVPVNAFWSVSVYNAEGFFQKNPQNAYTLNNLTAKKSADGSITMQFGDCDRKVDNCLPIVAGWNYTVRLYRPQAEILDGSWHFPSPEPIN